MAILTYLNETPLYSTVREAVRWGKERGLSGYHIHYYRDQEGYMGGATHQQSIAVASLAARTGVSKGIIPSIHRLQNNIPIQPQAQQTTPQVVRQTSTPPPLLTPPPPVAMLRTPQPPQRTAPPPPPPPQAVARTTGVTGGSSGGGGY